jgi:hypothetical protein
MRRAKPPRYSESTLGTVGGVGELYQQRYTLL